MLSRLSPAKRVVRLMSLPNPFGAVVPSSDHGVWMSTEERATAVAAFSQKQAAAGIKSWNIVPQNVYDPVIKAGLGMVVSFQDFIPHRMQGKCSEAVLEQTLNIYTEMKADGAKAYQIKYLFKDGLDRFLLFFHLGRLLDPFLWNTRKNLKRRERIKFHEFDVLTSLSKICDFSTLDH